MEPVLGLRVVRGRDWEWGDQDGGEGFVGTVVGLGESAVEVIVQWDMGQRCRYRCGKGSKFDIRVLDSGPISRTQVSGIECAWCQEDLVGCVWRCTRCLDYYLCSHCYITDRHCLRHPFFRIADSANKNNRVRLEGRMDSRKIVRRGVFPNSHVVRGIDWKWNNQDGGGGTRGKVIAIKNWKQESLRSVAEVQWEGKKGTNIYRLGHKGKVDLKCVDAAEGGSYYPDHLPVLGGEVNVAVSSQLLAAGDTVRIELDVAVLKLMQEDHGGWNDSIASIVGQAGMVNYVHGDGDPEVRYTSNQIYKLNADAVSKVEGLSVFFVGEVVKVIDDLNLVHDLQKDGPGWVDDIALTLGQVGVVTKLTYHSHAQVSVNGYRWVFSPLCLAKVSPDLLPKDSGEMDIDMNAKAQLLSVMPTADNLDLIVLAAASGDASTVRQLLQQHPEEVNRMVEGRTAVHEACKEGYIAALKTLLDFNADLELMDSNGLRPIHSCAYSNCGKAISLLVEHDADVNSKDANESTAAMVAASLGHNIALAALLAHPLINIQAGGPIGNTALQCATAARRSSSVCMLLKAGADPSIADYTGATPLHNAVAMGHYQIVELMLMYYPNYINHQKEGDGYSLVHMAATNRQNEVMELLLQQKNCNINSQTLGANLTALHIAAHEGHSSMIELLVGYGADLNAILEEGNTLLHIIVVKQNMKALDTTTPYLLQVQDKLKNTFGELTFATYTIVACMLVLEGADLYQKNTMGHSPLALSPPDTADVLRHVVEKCGRGTYHGSLRKFSVQLPLLEKDKTHCASVATGGGEIMEKKFTPKDLSKDKNSVSTSSQVTEPPPVEDNKQQSISTEAKRDTKSPETTKESSRDSDSDDRLCCLCDQEVNAELVPCGHSAMCSDCANMSKRCPICNVKIESALVTT